jgi:hypothetical protein
MASGGCETASVAALLRDRLITRDKRPGIVYYGQLIPTGYSSGSSALHFPCIEGPNEEGSIESENMVANRPFEPLVVKPDTLILKDPSNGGSLRDFAIPPDRPTAKRS